VNRDSVEIAYGEYMLTYTPSRKLSERERRKIKESFESQIDLLHKGQGNIHNIMVVMDQSFGANALEGHQLVLTPNVYKLGQQGESI
jgi:hypothetical protein